MQKSLVTGAAGFTGSNMCRYLAARGDRVTALVRPGSDTTALKGLDVAIVPGDIASDDGLPAEAFKGIDTVFHIAALFRQEGASRDVFMNVNAQGTVRVLRAAKRAGVSRFVHCSTAGVHGEIANPPANETAPLRPGDWYQESKLEGEKRALAFGRDQGLAVTAIRPSAIYGPGDLRFLKLFKSIQNGTFMMIGPGTAHYHFVFIDDLVRGFALAAAHPAAAGEVFIIAGPRSIPVGDLIRMISEELGKSPPKFHIPVWPVKAAAVLCKALCTPLGIAPPLYPRRLDIFTKYRSFDASKAATLLGYRPEVEPREGLARVAAWYREHHLIRPK